MLGSGERTDLVANQRDELLTQLLRIVVVGHRLQHLGMGMSEDQRPPRADVVDVPSAVGVDDVAAESPLIVDWVAADRPEAALEPWRYISRVIEILARKRSLVTRRAAAELRAELVARLVTRDSLTGARLRNLIARLDALAMRIRINSGDYAPFDEESEALFMSVAPTYDAAHFDATLARTEAQLLEGTATVGVAASLEGTRVILGDPSLLLYYQNRLVSFAEDIAEPSEMEAACEIQNLGAHR